MKNKLRIAIISAIATISFFGLVNVTEARSGCRWVGAHYHHGRYVPAHQECWRYKHHRSCYWKQGHWRHGVWHPAHQKCR